MDEQFGWWRVLTSLSPFLIPLMSAMLALLIRDLLEPRQWRRYVRKVIAGGFVGILVFAVPAFGHATLLNLVGSEDSLLVEVVSVIVGLGTLPAAVFAAISVFNRVEPSLDWYLDSRFIFSFQNGSWPSLSMDVRSECLPDGATLISGRIAAVRENIGEFRLRVVVETIGEVKTVFDVTTRNPRHGWMRVMRAVLKAQLGDVQENRKWHQRIQAYCRLGEWVKGLTPTSVPTKTARYRWKNDAYIQIHRLARRMKDRDVL